MRYIDLYNFLRNREGLNRVQSIRSIWNVRKFDPEIKAAMLTWVDTGSCNLTIADVSFEELTTKENMKPIRAFKMLDWLKREPAFAHRYLAQRRLRADLVLVGSAKLADDIEETDQSDIVL